MKDKLPVKFCWHCGRKLYGNTFILRKVDGFDRTIHKQCDEDLDNEEKKGWPTTYDHSELSNEGIE